MGIERQFNKNVARGVAAGVLLAVGGTACGGQSLKTSPATESPAYAGDPNAYGSNPANWKEVIVAETDIRELDPDVSMLIGFEVPGSDVWHESEPIDLRAIRSADFMLRIGPGPVKFRVQFVSNHDSDIMRIPPTTRFEGPETINQAEKKHQTLLVPSAWKSDS